MVPGHRASVGGLGLSILGRHRRAVPPARDNQLRPAALRSWTLPTRGECPLNPSPRLAILVAALILRPIRSADKLNTLAEGSKTATGPK